MTTAVDELQEVAYALEGVQALLALPHQQNAQINADSVYYVLQPITAKLNQVLAILEKPQ